MDEETTKLQEEMAYIMATDLLAEARRRFQEKKRESVNATRLHSIVWPVLFGIEGQQIRSDCFKDAKPPSGHG